jgi:hypothetical protein
METTVVARKSNCYAIPRIKFGGQRVVLSSCGSSSTIGARPPRTPDATLGDRERKSACLAMARGASSSPRGIQELGGHNAPDLLVPWLGAGRARMRRRRASGHHLTSGNHSGAREVAAAECGESRGAALFCGLCRPIAGLAGLPAPVQQASQARPF